MLEVYDKPCKNCLFSDEKIVDEKRKQQVLKDCLETDKHFICHKATLDNDKDICCHLFYQKYKGTTLKYKLATALNIPINWIKQDDIEPFPNFDNNH